MSDFLDFLSDNWIAVLGTLGGLVLVVLLILAVIPAPFDGGYVMSMRTEEERQWDTEEEEDIYRTEYYTTIETQSYSDSNGNRHTRTVPVTHSRQVYDHTDLVLYHHIDDADYIFVVNSFDNKAGYNWFERRFKKERPCKDFTIYVEKDVHDSFGIERPFHIEEHKYWRNDNITKRETGRKRIRGSGFSLF